MPIWRSGLRSGRASLRRPKPFSANLCVPGRSPNDGKVKKEHVDARREREVNSVAESPHQLPLGIKERDAIDAVGDRLRKFDHEIRRSPI